MMTDLPSTDKRPEEFGKMANGTVICQGAWRSISACYSAASKAEEKVNALRAKIVMHDMLLLLLSVYIIITTVI